MIGLDQLRSKDWRYVKALLLGSPPSERTEIDDPEPWTIGPRIAPTLIEDHPLMIPLYMTKTQKRWQRVKSTMRGLAILDAQKAMRVRS